MIDSLLSEVEAFRDKLARIRISKKPGDFEWYPHDTLAVFRQLDRLLKGENRKLLAPRRGTVLDLCCGDGDVSFFLESLGYEVDAVDHPVYNHNGMRGVRTLKEALGSQIRLFEVDIDRQFTLPREHYDLVIFLGVLYHVRNPFYVLEEIARHTRRCVLSTRVSSRFPNGKAMPKGIAAAYLLEEYELNNDETNYFIFSEQGLRVLLQRTYFDIADYLLSGNEEDQRVFCLLDSRYGNVGDIELGEGWHAPEGSGWRWTEQSFTLRAKAAPRQRTLKLELFLPDGLPPVTLSMTADGRHLPPATYETPGSQTLTRPIDASETSLAFHLSSCRPPDATDARERGVIVKSVTIQ